MGDGERGREGAGSPGPWTIEEYVTASGRNLALRFLSGLNRQDKAEAIALLKLLGERGNKLGMPHSKALGRGLLELRGRHGVRLFYTFRPGRRVVLLDGMVKKRGDIPPDMLDRLRDLLVDLKAREREGSWGNSKA